MMRLDAWPFLYRLNEDRGSRFAPLSSSHEGNSAELLRLLRRHGPVSRADLTRLSGLTAPTVSAGIAKLLRRDLVVALGQGSSSGGRPPSLLEFNARHGYVIGVDIGGSSLRLALADFNGAILGRWVAPLKTDRSPGRVTEMVGAAVTQLLRRHKIPVRKIFELVAGAPGITDVAAGRVVSAPNLTNWRDVPFRDLLENRTRIPASIENDVNLAALGEGWRGAARGAANFVFLAVGTGIGSGIVVNNMLHHGATWSAGEVGYMLLPGLRSTALIAGDLGALENAAGGKGIEHEWSELVGAVDGMKPMQATDIFDMAKMGDQKARKLMASVADQLAMAITNLSLVLDLSIVVLGGGVGSHPALLDCIRRRLERNEFARPELVTSSLDGEAQMCGAIWLALRTAELSGYRRRTMRT